jgi:hypothetical protein
MAMADWTLTPDTLDDADAGASSPQVPTGLAPTAVLPATLVMISFTYMRSEADRVLRTSQSWLSFSSQ